MRTYWAVLYCAALGLIVGCDPGLKSGRGFTLPDGNAERGETAFVELKCYACHEVSGVELPAPDENAARVVTIGGKVSRIQTYGELVTSIINPSHKLAKGYLADEVSQEGKSLMKNNNDAMTVSQLIDLVAFLQSHYKLKPYDRTNYPIYLNVTDDD